MAFPKLSIVSVLLIILPFLLRNSLFEATNCEDLQSFCKYRFCEPKDGEDGVVTTVDSNQVLLRAPFRAQFPFIYRPDLKEKLGTIRAVGEAHLVSKSHEPIPISKWNPPGLTKPFSPYYFRPFRIPATELQGIGRTSAGGNQEDFLYNKCFVMPIYTIDLVDDKNGFIATGLTRRKEDCISFAAKKAGVVIDISYRFNGTVKLSATAADGTLADFVRGNNGGSSCNPGSATAAFSGTSLGMYTVTLTYESIFRNTPAIPDLLSYDFPKCPPAPGNWRKIGRDLIVEVPFNSGVLMRKVLDIPFNSGPILETFTLNL